MKVVRRTFWLMKVVRRTFWLMKVVPLEKSLRNAGLGCKGKHRKLSSQRFCTSYVPSISIICTRPNVNISVRYQPQASWRTWCNSSWRLITARTLTRKLRYDLHPFPGQQVDFLRKAVRSIPLNSRMLLEFVRNFWHFLCCHMFPSKSGSSKRTFTYT